MGAKHTPYHSSRKVHCCGQEWAYLGSPCSYSPASPGRVSLAREAFRTLAEWYSVLAYVRPARPRIKGPSQRKAGKSSTYLLIHFLAPRWRFDRISIGKLYEYRKLSLDFDKMSKDSTSVSSRVEDSRDYQKFVRMFLVIVDLVLSPYLCSSGGLTSSCMPRAERSHQVRTGTIRNVS